MNLETAFCALLAYTLTREVYFMHTTHKLLNKAMSRSFHEYQLADGINKRVLPKKDNFVYDEGDKEDLGVLTGII